MNDLKPCPFCGNTPVLVRWGNGWCVECHSLGCQVMPETPILLKQEAIEQLVKERDAAIDCIYAIEDALDRGNDNDWARECIDEWCGVKEDNDEVD